MLPFFVLDRNTSLSSFCACLVVFLIELFDTSGGIHDFLRSGIERMALGTNFNMKCRLAQGGFSVELVAAAAGNCNFGILWMSVCFHFVILCQ